MKLADKVFFGNYPLAIIFYPIILIARFIGWIRLPNKIKFCNHDWKARKLKANYGVFGGMEVYKCSKCGTEDWNRNAEKRLHRNGLI